MGFRKSHRLLQMAAINILRHKVKALTVIVPIVFCIGLAAAVSFVRDGFQRDAELAARMLPDVTVQKMVAGRLERINKAAIDEIKKIDDAMRVLPRIWGYIPLKVKGKDAVYTVIGLLPETVNLTKNLHLCLETGVFPDLGVNRGVVVGKAFAEAMQLQNGDSFALEDAFGRRERFQVAGVFKSAIAIYSADLILMKLEDASRFFNYQEGEASDICIYLDDPTRADMLAAEILARLPGLRVLTRDALGDITRQSYGSRAGVFGLMWLIILLSVILTVWAQGVSIRFEGAKEIGILKAMGWSIGDIIYLKLYEGLILSIGATTLGLIAGLGYVLIEAPGIKGYFLGWSSIYPEFAIPIYIDPATLVTLFCLGVFPFLFASVIPAWWAGILEPDRSLRT